MAQCVCCEVCGVCRLGRGPCRAFEVTVVPGSSIPGLESRLCTLVPHGSWLLLLGVEDANCVDDKLTAYPRPSNSCHPRVFTQRGLGTEGTNCSPRAQEPRLPASAALSVSRFGFRVFRLALRADEVSKVSIASEIVGMSRRTWALGHGRLQIRKMLNQAVSCKTGARGKSCGVSGRLIEPTRQNIQNRPP